MHALRSPVDFFGISSHGRYLANEDSQIRGSTPSNVVSPHEFWTSSERDPDGKIDANRLGCNSKQEIEMQASRHVDFRPLSSLVPGDFFTHSRWCSPGKSTGPNYLVSMLLKRKEVLWSLYFLTIVSRSSCCRTTVWNPLAPADKCF
jgi:hypothetical protein